MARIWLSEGRRESLGTVSSDTQPGHRVASPANPCAQRAQPAAHGAPAAQPCRGPGEKDWDKALLKIISGLEIEHMEQTLGSISRLLKPSLIQILERQSLIQRHWKNIRRTSLIPLKLTQVPTQLEFHCLKSPFSSNI